jgi:hypothetical protein
MINITLECHKKKNVKKFIIFTLSNMDFGSFLCTRILQCASKSKTLDSITHHLYISWTPKTWNFVHTRTSFRLTCPKLPIINKIKICNYNKFLTIIVRSKVDAYNYVSHWHAPKLLERLKCEFKVKIARESRIGAPSLARNTLGAERGVLELRNGTRKNDKHLFIQKDLHKTKQQVG